MRRRDVVDHTLARRALLRSLYGGGLFTTTSSYDVCDASVFLKRVAEAYGVGTDRSCPICRKEQLWEVAWVPRLRLEPPGAQLPDRHPWHGPRPTQPQGSRLSPHATSATMDAWVDCRTSAGSAHCC